MLDIDLFRVDRGGNPDIVRESQRRRHKDVSLVDKVIELDTEWRTTRGGLDNAKKVLNQVQKKIGEFMKKKETPPPELMKEKQDADAEIIKLEAKEKEAQTSEAALAVAGAKQRARRWAADHAWAAGDPLLIG